MSLRATEFEARIWRSARERMAKRPRLLADYYRRRWGRWLEMLALLSVGISLPVPVFVVAIQMANGQFFPGMQVTDGMAFAMAAGTLATSFLFAWTWYHAAQTDGLWSIALASPLSDEAMARHWILWRVGFAGVFVAPVTVFHAIVLNGPLGGWQSAMMWGTLIAVAEMATLISTTLLLAVVVGKWLHDWRWVIGMVLGFSVVTLLCVWPIQFLQPRGVAFAGRRLLWWPTGWPLAAFESVLQADFLRATWLLVAVGVWSAAGFAAALRLIQSCSIRTFRRSGLTSQLWPLFDQPSVWGPVEETPPRVLSKWEQAFSGGQQAPSFDFAKLETSDEALTAAEARYEVQRGEFLQPLANERLGWMEKVLLLSLFDRERQLAHGLMLDGRYWTRAVKFWWIVCWAAAVWFSVLPAIVRMQQPGGEALLVVIPVVIISGGLGITAVLTTIWVVFFGWPGWMWSNSANKSLPIFAHLPISPRELSALRQRVTLLKLVVVLAVVAPVLIGFAWINGAAWWPVLKVAAKLAFVLFVVQSWWFIVWQLSGSFFRTLGFYLTMISLLLVDVVLAVFFLMGDEHLEWSVPSMVLCAKLMSWLLGRTLDRPVFDLTGANMAQQHRSFSLQLETPKL